MVSEVVKLRLEEKQIFYLFINIKKESYSKVIWFGYFSLYLLLSLKSGHYFLLNIAYKQLHVLFWNRMKLAI